MMLSPLPAGIRGTQGQSPERRKILTKGWHWAKCELRGDEDPIQQGDLGVAVSETLSEG